jgi:hypothetical protein
MRPPNAGESKALRAHLKGEGDERPGIGPECFGWGDRTCGPAIREVVMGPRCGQSRARDLPHASGLCPSRMVMDSRPGFSRSRDLGPRPFPRTSRMVG